METRVGFFKYDLFPYVICHHIIGWSDEGHAMAKGGLRFKHSALIHSLPQETGGKYEAMVERAKSEYRREEKQLRERLLSHLHTDAPFLRPEER